MATKRLTRIWTDAEKAAAIALLARNGGNVKRTVREFRTSDGASISESTIRGFRDNPPPAPVIEAAELAYDQLLGIAKSFVMKLAAGLNRDETVSRLLSKPDKATVAMAVGIDKIRLLEGLATEITEQTVTYAEPGALRKLALTVIEGGREEAS